MSKIAYCPTCHQVVLTNDVTGFNTCPRCNEKYVFTEVNQHAWYLMTPEEKEAVKTKWFGKTTATTSRSARKTASDGNQEQAMTTESKQRQIRLEPLKGDFLFTTGSSFDGRPVNQYIGVFSGNCQMYHSPDRDFASTLDTAKARALTELKNKCITAGADAAVGLSFSIVTLAGATIVCADGTAVKLH